MTPDPAHHPFDAATAVRWESSDVFAARPSESYWAFVGPFGGATAATLLRALMQHRERLGEPVSLTVNFAAPLTAHEYCIHTERARSNRSTQHWFARVLQGDDPEPRATATAVFADRRQSWSHHSVVPPAVRTKEELEKFEPGATVPWVYKYSFCFDTGAPVRAVEPLSSPQSSYSQLWLADTPERPVDVLSLAAMADAFFGRIFLVRGVIVPFGTVSLTVYFHTDADELAALRPSWLVGRAHARRFHRSYCDQTGELWSPDGNLLATTHQIAFFKS